MIYPSLINLTPESFLRDLLSPLSLTVIPQYAKSDITSAVTQKIQASPPSSNFRNLHILSVQITQHPLLSVSFPFSKSNLPLFHLFLLQTCCTPDTSAGRRILHSHPWLREVLLLLTPESIPATTHQAPSSPLSVTPTQLP